MRAIEVPVNNLFHDEDGDLYVRMLYGAVRFDDKQGELVYYDEDSLLVYDFLEECEIVEGEIMVVTHDQNL